MFEIAFLNLLMISYGVISRTSDPKMEPSS
jgi:hypothetical protein